MSNKARLDLMDGIEALLLREPSLRIGDPITWTVDHEGNAVPLSRYGDDRIDMSPYLSNPAAGQRSIALSPIPEEWYHSFLETILSFWRFGCPPYKRPKASTVIYSAYGLTIFVRWLHQLGVRRFGDVRPIHYAQYASYITTTPIETGSRTGKLRTKKGVEAAMGAALLPWKMRSKLRDSVPDAPFDYRGGKSKALHISASPQNELTTYCMTWDEIVALFGACERSLIDAEFYLSLLDGRSEVILRAESEGLSQSGVACRYARWLKKECGLTAAQYSSKITEIREAASTELMLLVGQRISEFMSMEIDCIREDEAGDESTMWLSSRTFKSKDSSTDYIVTEWMAPRRADTLIGFLTRISQEHQCLLQQEIGAVESRLDESMSERDRAGLLSCLNMAKRSQKSLFLSRVNRFSKNSGRKVGIASRYSVASWVKNMALRASIVSEITPQVLRRTFAFMVVNQCNGDLRYLRKHFKHWSIDTTAAYASHPERDAELSDAIGRELLELKTDMIARWLQEDEVLGGAGGDYIKRVRESPRFVGYTFADRKEAAAVLQKGLVVRPTGHGLCLASGSVPCGGRGLYDPKECASGCAGAVVTREELPIWVRLTEQMLEVERMRDCGPAVASSVDESLVAFDSVLRNFGLSVNAVRDAMRGGGVSGSQ